MSPEPYTLRELLADTLTAPLRPAAVFDAAARRPTPGFAAMAANVALYACLFFAINTLRFTATAGALGYPLERVAVVGGAALLSFILASFAGAGALHAVALIAGGSGGYARSYQAFSMLAALLPLQAAALWYPPAAALPPLWAAALSALAIERFHGASPRAARGLFAALAAFALFSGWVVTRQVRQALSQYAAMQRGLSHLGSLQTPAEPRPLEGMPQALPSEEIPQARLSGLDLLSAPSAAGGTSAAPGPVDEPQTKSVTDASANLLAAALPLLNDPALIKNLDVEQRKKLRELTQLVARMQSQLSGGAPMTPREREEAMAKIQSLMPQLMMMGAGAEKPAR